MPNPKKTPKAKKRVYKVEMLVVETEFKWCCDDCRWLSQKFIAESIKDQFALDDCRIKSIRITPVKRRKKK